MTWVKICGTTNLEDALVAVEAGADAVGFVFYEKSPRNVTVETAREIVKELPDRVEKVGVFVDAECDRIRELVLHVGFTAVQLHGTGSIRSYTSNDGSAVDCVGVSKPILMIPADALKGGVMISNRLRQRTFALLIDAQMNGAAGGMGVTFDWEETQGMVHTLSLSVPVIIAGGLTPSNVGNAMRLFQPFGVDVVSGVEARPGKKDPEKLHAFVRAVREIDRKAS